MDDIEKIKIYRDASHFISNALQQKLKKELNIGEIDNVLTRISGLEAEDELVLILFFLGSCNNIVRLDQNISRLINPNFTPPDLLCTFKLGSENVFIEAKKTDKDSWEITRTNFQKRKKFAQLYNIPLYFAIRIRGFWGLFSCEYLEKQGLKIQIKDFKNNSFDKFTDNFIVLLPKGIQIKSIYSKSEDGIGVKNRNYGNLIHWKIKYEDKAIVVNKGNRDRLIWNFIMEPVHDYLSDKSKITQRADLTIVEEKLEHNLIVNAYLFFLSVIRHTLHKEGVTFNVSGFLKEQIMEKKNTFPISKNILIAVLNDMKRIVPLIIFKTAAS